MLRSLRKFQSTFSRNQLNSILFPQALQEVRSTQSRRNLQTQPENVTDPQIRKALDTLLAISWNEINHKTKHHVKKVLDSSPSSESKAALENTWHAAEAVEIFSDKLEHLRSALDSLSGGKFGGENVAVIPDYIRKALESALQKYQTYLSSFDESELWLKKKVEQELGSSLLQVKQRCSGLEPEWAKISLLGTSGLSGSYIEKRA